MEDLLLMKRYNEIMDIIQEPLEWMTIGAVMAIAIMVLIF